MIFVENEFAPLKRVVVAQSEFGYPIQPKEDDLRFLNETELQESLNNKEIWGKNFAEVYPDLQKQWELERINLTQVLQRYGVEVFHPRKLTNAEKNAVGKDGYANFFCRDPFFTIGNFVIEGSLRFLQRRNEVFPLREIFEKVVYPEDCIYIAVPQPEITDDTDLTLGKGPFLEGGDVLVYDKTVFVGNSGLASNDLGIFWLTKLLKPHGYTVKK